MRKGKEGKGEVDEATSIDDVEVEKKNCTFFSRSREHSFPFPKAKKKLATLVFDLFFSFSRFDTSFLGEFDSGKLRACLLPRSIRRRWLWRQNRRICRRRVAVDTDNDSSGGSFLFFAVSSALPPTTTIRARRRGNSRYPQPFALPRRRRRSPRRPGLARTRSGRLLRWERRPT